MNFLFSLVSLKYTPAVISQSDADNLPLTNPPPCAGIDRMPGHDPRSQPPRPSSRSKSRGARRGTGAYGGCFPRYPRGSIASSSAWVPLTREGTKGVPRTVISHRVVSKNGLALRFGSIWVLEIGERGNIHKIGWHDQVGAEESIGAAWCWSGPCDREPILGKHVL